MTQQVGTRYGRRYVHGSDKNAIIMVVNSIELAWLIASTKLFTGKVAMTMKGAAHPSNNTCCYAQSVSIRPDCGFEIACS
jgi:hypothetical protein